MFNLLFFSPSADLLNCRYSTAKIPLFRSISCSYAMRRSDLSLTQSVLTPGCLVKLKVLMRISVRFHSLDLPPQIFSIYILSIETDSNLIFNINLIQSSGSFYDASFNYPFSSFQKMHRFFLDFPRIPSCIQCRTGSGRDSVWFDVQTTHQQHITLF